MPENRPDPKRWRRHALQQILVGELENRGIRTEAIYSSGEPASRFGVNVWKNPADRYPMDTVWIDPEQASESPEGKVHTYCWGPSFEYKGDLIDVLRYFLKECSS